MIYNISVGWEYTVWLSLLRGKTLVRQLLWICMLTLLNASCLLMYAWLSATRHLLNCIIFRLQWGTNLYENQIWKNNQRDKRKIHLPCSSPQSTNVKTHLGNWPDLTPWTTVGFAMSHKSHSDNVTVIETRESVGAWDWGCCVAVEMVVTMVLQRHHGLLLLLLLVTNRPRI